MSLVLLGLFTDGNDAFPYPFIYFSWGNLYPFLYLKPRKGTPFASPLAPTPPKKLNEFILVGSVPRNLSRTL